MGLTWKINWSTANVKRIVLVLNALWALLGFGLIIISLIYWSVQGAWLFSTCVLILGCLMAATSVLGFWSIFNEKPLLLWIYALAMLLLLPAIVAYSLITRHNVLNHLTLGDIEEAWIRELTQPGAMDSFQLQYECCGRFDAQDYLKIGRTPPASCCKQSNCEDRMNINHARGCLLSVSEAYGVERGLSQTFQWIIIVLDFVLLCLGVLLARRLMKRRPRESS